MADKGEGSGFGRFAFSMSEGGDLSWSHMQGASDLTTEQAAVVAQMQGMRDIARGLEAIADAIAEHTRVVAKAHGVTED